MITEASLALDIWLSYQRALNANRFTDPLLISICEEEEEEWRNIYLALSKADGVHELAQLGFHSEGDDSTQLKPPQ